MRVERGTALAGFAFVAATAGTVVSEARGPHITNTAAQVTAQIASDRADVLINSVLHIGLGVSVLFLAAGLATLIAQRGGRRMVPLVALAAGVMTAAASLLSAVLSATVASSIQHLDDSQAPYLLYRAAQTSGTASIIFFAITIAAAAIGLGRAELLSAAKARIGLAVAIALLAAGFDYLAPDAGPLSVVEPIAGVLALVYVVLVGVGLLGTSPVADPDHVHASTSAVST